ncbi:MAG: tripartite tricarboxylate transporter TctB family protein [Candidatus Rokubacteria bacterium]|nr:tripartite tricarboxylate transporter TctB family protein [Candidatus Rokubacteria bacterium]
MSTDRISGLVFALFGLAVLLASRALPFGTLHRPGPAFVPVVLATVLVTLAVLVLIFGGRSRSLRAADWSEAGHAASILAAGAFAAAALESLGYRITMTVALAFLLGVKRRTRPVVVVSVAVGFAVVSYWTFRRLGVLLPDGPLGF